MADYLDSMNAISDNLALAGQPVSDDELVQIILNNLGPALEMLVNAAQARDTPITYRTLKALILTIERRIMEQVVHVVEDSPINAFVATYGRGGHFCGSGVVVFRLIMVVLLPTTSKSLILETTINVILP